MHFPTQYLNNLKVDRKQILLPENWASENLSDLPEFDRGQTQDKNPSDWKTWSGALPPWQGGAHRDCSVSSYLWLGKYLCVHSPDDSGSGSLVSGRPQLLASYLTWVLVTSYPTTLMYFLMVWVSRWSFDMSTMGYQWAPVLWINQRKWLENFGFQDFEPDPHILNPKLCLHF